MERRSRVETQAATRRELLHAAELAFAADGFEGASLDRIAAAAGFTRGAIYSNFDGKADLFVTVLDGRLQRRIDEVTSAMAASATPGDFVGALREPSWSNPRPTDEVIRWNCLVLEFRLYALRDPVAAERLARYERQMRDRYAEAATHLLGQLGVDMPADPRLVAAILFALDESLIRQHLMDPSDVPAHAYAEAVELLLNAAAALGRA